MIGRRRTVAAGETLKLRIGSVGLFGTYNIVSLLCVPRTTATATTGQTFCVVYRPITALLRIMTNVIAKIEIKVIGSLLRYVEGKIVGKTI